MRRSCVLSELLRAADHIGHQAELACWVYSCRYHRVTDLRVGQQDLLDLTGLDAVAANLDWKSVRPTNSSHAPARQRTRSPDL